MSKPLLLDEMTWTEVRQNLERGAIVILPIGSVEQHGPHLPLGTDTIIPYELAKRVGENLLTITAPPVWYGSEPRPRSSGGRDFTGNTSVPGMTFVSNIRDIIKDLLAHDVTRIVVINWHFENSPFIYEAMQRAKDETKERKSKFVIITDPANLLSKKTINFLFPDGFPGWEIEHASVLETSLMMILRPNLVRKERIADDSAKRIISYDVIPTPPDVITQSGVLYKATLASMEKGKRAVEDIVSGLCDVIQKEFSD